MAQLGMRRGQRLRAVVGAVAAAAVEAHGLRRALQLALVPVEEQEALPGAERVVQLAGAHRLMQTLVQTAEEAA